MVCQDCCYKTILQVKENPEKWNCSNCSCKNPFVLEHCKVIEALLNMDKMQFKCENLNSGCKETLHKEKMKVHQAECIYRPIKCTGFVGSCESKVPFHELLDHFKHLEAKPGTILFSTFGTRMEKHFLQCLHRRKMVTFPLRKFVVSDTTFLNASKRFISPLDCFVWISK